MADLDNSNTPSDSGNMPPVDVAASPEIIPPSMVSVSDLLGGAPSEQKGVILNRDGSIRKKPGRKPGQKYGTSETTSAPSSEAPAAPKSPQEKKAVRLGCDQTARAVLNMVVGGMRELVGPEWDFQSQEEADGMRIAVAAYIESKGGGEMSPELALFLVTTGYAAPRFKEPNTREKFGAFFGTAWKAITDVFKR